MFCLLIPIFLFLLILRGYRITACFFYIFLSIRLSLSCNNFVVNTLVCFVNNNYLVFRTPIDNKVGLFSDGFSPN